MKKRIFSLFMVFTLCFVNVNQVYADAGSLIIAGGSVAGVTAGAIAGPAVVAVFCAMMAFGMNVELSQASQESGMTKTEYIKNKIAIYCEEAQISANTFNNYVLDQAKILQNGSISISNQAAKTIEKFCNWLFQSDQVNNPTSASEVVGYINILGKSAPMVRQGYTGLLFLYPPGGDPYTYIIERGITDYAIIICRKTPDYAEAYAISRTPFDSSNTQISITGVTQTYGFQNYNGYYICTFWGGNTSDITLSTNNIPIYDGYVLGEVLDQLDGTWNPVINGANDTVTGNETDYDTSKHVLNPTNDQTVIINPNITIPVPQDKDVTIDVNEYLDVVQDMIDGLRDDLITAIDDATDVPITIEFDPTQDWDPTIEKEDDTDLPPDDEKTPVIVDDIIPHDFDPDPMKFDIKGIFPFCIPWDVKDMLNKLSADPLAPSYTVNWLIPIVNERLIFTVDLTPFNGVAQVCRTMELLAFCIGLAVVTRQLFLRG